MQKTLFLIRSLIILLANFHTESLFQSSVCVHPFHILCRIAYFFHLSMALMLFSSSSGSVLGGKYETTLPSALTKNLAKFHGISLAWCLAASYSSELLRRYLYTSQVYSPLTSVLENRGNSAEYRSRANALISALEPGSWLINWLQG